MSETQQDAAAPTRQRRIPVNRAVREALDYEMERDSSVVMLGEDIGIFGGVYQTATGFLEKYGPERVRDTPISEAGFIAASAGAAMYGLKPVVELMFIDFIGVCLDPIYNMAAKNAYHSAGRQPVPMVIVTGVGGGVSDASQHSQTLYATLAHLPGLKIVVPSNAYDARGLMHAAIADPNPVVYMIHKGVSGMGWFHPVKEANTIVPDERFEVPIGKAFVRRPGRDVTLVGWGITVHMAMTAAAALEEGGVSAEVIDLVSLAPMDRATIVESVTRTGRLLVVDEDYRHCGVAAEVIASVVECVSLRAPARRVCFPDVPIPYSRPMEDYARPSPEKILRAVEEIL